MEVLIVILCISLVLNIFFFFWLRNMKNILVFIADKKVLMDNSINSFIDLCETVEKNDVYLNDPNIKKIIYSSYKLNRSISNSFKKIYEVLDLDIIEDLSGLQEEEDE